MRQSGRGGSVQAEILASPHQFSPIAWIIQYNDPPLPGEARNIVYFERSSQGGGLGTLSQTWNGLVDDLFEHGHHHRHKRVEKNEFSDAYESGISDLIPSNSVSMTRPKGGGMPFQLSFITRYAAEQLLKPTGYNLSQMQERIKAEGKPVSQEINGIKATVKTAVGQKDFSASNVIGVIEGSDPVLKNECIVYSAHYDHVGLNSRGDAFNGADDARNLR